MKHRPRFRGIAHSLSRNKNVSMKLSAQLRAQNSLSINSANLLQSSFKSLSLIPFQVFAHKCYTLGVIWHGIFWKFKFCQNCKKTLKSFTNIFLTKYIFSPSGSLIGVVHYRCHMGRGNEIYILRLCKRKRRLLRGKGVNV